MISPYVKVSWWVAAAVLVAPMHLQAQVDDTDEHAVMMETEAARLAQQRDRWADAASLYVAAARLRQREAPQARQNLFLAADLQYRLGDREDAVAALDSAGVWALSAGDSVFASEMFANAATIAHEAGLTETERSLRARVADLANASGRSRTRS